MTRIKKQTHPGVEPTEPVRARVGGGLSTSTMTRVRPRPRCSLRGVVVGTRSTRAEGEDGRTDASSSTKNRTRRIHRLHSSRSSLRTHPVVVLSAVPTAHRRSFRVVGLSVVDEGKTASSSVEMRSSFVAKRTYVGIDRAKFGSVVPGFRRASSCAGRRVAPRRTTR